MASCCDHEHPKSARAVHLWYELPPDTVTVSNEVQVLESSSGSYFCVIGFRGGYCGIQERRNGEKVAIFSVWDIEENCQEDQQVKVISQGEGVKVSRFGGEGTGIKTIIPFDWSIGQAVKFKIAAEKDDGCKWTTFSGYVFLEPKRDWFKMAKLQTITNGRLIRGVYSFVEDFKRNKSSYHERRRAHFGDCSAEHTTGERILCRRARFTASKSEATNINACCCEGKFLLETGSEIQNTGAQLRNFIHLDSSAD